MRIDKVCAYCGGKFIAQKTITQTCSDDCAKRYYKRRKRDEKIHKAIQQANIQKPYNPVIKDKEYLSVDETCLLLGASRWTIYRLIEKSSLAIAKVGRRTIIKKSSIDQLFNPSV
jgi:excisionase family DNA binding protein